MNKQEAIEIIGEQLLAIWPNLDDDQKEAVRAGLSDLEREALDIALGLVEEPQPAPAIETATQWTDTWSQVEPLSPAVQNLADALAEDAKAEPKFVVGIDWGKVPPHALVLKTAQDRIEVVDLKQKPRPLDWTPVYVLAILAVVAIACWAFWNAVQPVI